MFCDEDDEDTNYIYWWVELRLRFMVIFSVKFKFMVKFMDRGKDMVKFMD